VARKRQWEGNFEKDWLIESGMMENYGKDENMLICVIYRRGAPGGKLKMTLGLPVYVLHLSHNTPTSYQLSFNAPPTKINTSTHTKSTRASTNLSVNTVGPS
jgi:hypothetical protein